MRCCQLFLAAAFLISLGCDGQARREAQPAAAPAGGVAIPMPQQRKGAQDRVADEKAEPAQDRAKVPVDSARRKIVYNGTVQLIVKDLDEAEGKLRAILKEFGAFVANSELTGSAGSPRSGHWRVRVPVERFEEFMTEIVRLGVPQKNSTDSQDVTDEYYDLEDRIKNKKLELETLREYLKEKRATSKLEEILTIEKELSRVRTELDQLEGKLRRLKDITALATANVTLQEVKDYVPPQAPTFTGSVQGTFADSIDLLLRFGRGVALVAVALAPWLAVLVVVAVPCWQLGRRYWKKSHEVLTVAPGDEEPPA
jgi:hypothetical protein